MRARAWQLRLLFRAALAGGVPRTVLACQPYPRECAACIDVFILKEVSRDRGPAVISVHFAAEPLYRGGIAFPLLPTRRENGPPCSTPALAPQLTKPAPGLKQPAQVEGRRDGRGIARPSRQRKASSLALLAAACALSAIAAGFHMDWDARPICPRIHRSLQMAASGWTIAFALKIATFCI